MDNQPMGSPQPASPLNQPAPEPTPLPTPGPIPEPVPEPTPTPTPIPTSGKKRKKGLIATIVAIAILIIGGGAFAAACIISNQPENIAASAMSNLINAKQVGVDGSINVSFPASDYTTADSFSLSLSAQNSPDGNTSTANLQINFTDDTAPISISLGEVMLKDGVLYLQANGLRDAYYNSLYSYVQDSLLSQLSQQYRYTLLDNCLDATTFGSDEYYNCYDAYGSSFTLDPATEASVREVLAGILDQIGDTISSIDGQWLELSIDSIMNHEMLASIDIATRQFVITTYDCTVDKLNNFANYSNELADLYGQNPFVNITSGQDSFYDVSFRANELASFINATPQTQIFKDIAACFGTSVPADANLNASADTISGFLSYLPQISAKFDGLFNHHLTELKITQQNSAYALNSDLKFTYPSSVNISAPADSTPVMDVVSEFYNQINSIQGYYPLQ